MERKKDRKKNTENEQNNARIRNVWQKLNSNMAKTAQSRWHVCNRPNMVDPINVP